MSHLQWSDPSKHEGAGDPLNLPPDQLVPWVPEPNITHGDASNYSTVE